MPRSVLRVPEVLAAIAVRAGGVTLADLSQALDLPKSSLLRLLRALAAGGYVEHDSHVYRLGRESHRLAALIGPAGTAAEFPTCARPALAWLQRETGETVMLAVLSEQQTEIVYVDVIESESPLRFTVRTGNRRPLFSVAAGKALLAFLPTKQRRDYIARTDFLQFTDETTRKAALPAILETTRADGVVFDRNGIVDGASAVASPVFDGGGKLICSISAAGPTERLEARLDRTRALVREAAERISTILGFEGAYPPPLQ